MAEIITFSQAVDPPKTVFRISLLAFDLLNSTITVQLREWDGTQFVGGDRVVIALYTGSTAMTLMIALNKANLPVQSLYQRVYARLLTDGKIPSGTVTGSVD